MPSHWPIKLRHERARSRVVEHPIHLCGQHLGVLQAILLRQPYQRLIRPSAPEKIRKPRREFVRRQRIDTRLRVLLLDSEQKLRPDQHRLQRQLHTFFIWVAAFGRTIVQRKESIDLSGSTGRRKPAAEAFQESVAPQCAVAVAARPAPFQTGDSARLAFRTKAGPAFAE